MDRPALVTALAVGLLATGVVLGGTASAGATSKWGAPLGGGSGGQAMSASPAAPAAVDATCAEKNTTVIKVTWPAAAHATAYDVYESKSSGSYASVATVTTASWTSARLAAGTYTFEVATLVGTHWTSGLSSASTSRTINKTKCS